MLRGMPLQAITAIGRDRPGIVAALTRELLALGGTLADSQMSIMRGHFTVMLICELPEELEPGELDAALGRVRDGLALDVVRASPLSGDPPERPSPTHVLSVYGSDHPGIVHHIANVLADHSVNITDVNTRVLGEEDGVPVYAMLLEVTLPRSLDPAALDNRIQAVAKELGVDASLHPADADVL